MNRTQNRSPRLVRLWSFALLAWAGVLAWYYLDRSVLVRAAPGRIDFAIQFSESDTWSAEGRVLAQGRLRAALRRPALGSMSGGPDSEGRGPRILGAVATGSEEEFLRYAIRLHDAGRALPTAWCSVFSGERLFPFSGGRSDLARASAVFELPGPREALWLGAELTERPRSGAAGWRVDGTSLAALRDGVLVVGAAVVRSPDVGVEPLWLMLASGSYEDREARDHPLLAALEAWRAELDAVLPASASLPDLVVVHTPPEAPPVPTLRAARHTLFGLAGTGPMDRERFQEELALARLAGRGPLPASAAWLDPSLARRIALAQLPKEREAERWRALLAQGVFLSHSTERALCELSALNPSDPYGHAYLARHKGPLLMLQVEGSAQEVQDPVAAWIALRDALGSGASLEDAAGRIFGREAAPVLAVGVRSSAPIRVQPIGEELRLRPPGPWEPSGVRVALAITADTENHLETCGCKLHQAGGIARRAQLVVEAARGDSLLALDLGNVYPRLEREIFDDLTAGELALHARINRNLGYAVHVLGPNELYAGPERLGVVSDDDRPYFASCNVRPVGDAPAVWSREVIRMERGGIRLRIVPVSPTTSYWIAPEEFYRRSAGVEIVDPVEAVKRACADVEPDERIVVVGALPTWRIPELLREVPGIGLVVSSDLRVPADWGGRRAGGVPSLLASGFLGDVAVILANQESHGLTLVDLDLDPHGRVLNFQQRDVLLSADRVEHGPTRELLDEFYRSLEVGDPGTPGADGARRSPLAELEIEATLRDAGEGGSSPYVGSTACKACHAQIHERWSRTPHGTALRTLEDVHRANSPACIRCHVVGYGLPGGFSAARPGEQEGLRGVGCETCHGPGGRHVERGGDPAAIRREFARSACELCHDAKHSEPLDGRAHHPAHTCLSSDPQMPRESNR